MAKKNFDVKSAIASMDAKLYEKCLANFRKTLKENKVQTESEIEERRVFCKEMQKYTKERLKTLSEDDFYNLIAPLWAMNIWGNKKYYVDTLIENNGMDTLRGKLSNLLHGTQTLEQRWDDFMEHVKGFGPAMMSELLNKFNPNEYILWNSKAKNAFLALNIPNVSRNGGIDGKRYTYYCEIAKELKKTACNKGFKEIDNLLSLDYFVWQELQIEQSAITTKEPASADDAPESEKEKKFIHNDVRDKIADIGRMLGFNADTERKIATGAVVDAIWEVSVGNMGRISYVFEVQTSGSTDSLAMNLMKAKKDPCVQGIIAVSDAKQIETMKKETAELPYNIGSEIKWWNYEDVLQVHESLSSAFEKINSLGLVPNK